MYKAKVEIRDTVAGTVIDAVTKRLGLRSVTIDANQGRPAGSRPYLLGTFVWKMFDFASDGRREGDTYGRNDKGLVTYDRLTRKDAFYWYKANWTTTPFVYVTSRRWTARTTAVTTIKVYGTVDSVVLTLNGVALGPAKTSTNHIYGWPNVTLAPGTNTVQATVAANATPPDSTPTEVSAVWTSPSSAALGQRIAQVSRRDRCDGRRPPGAWRIAVPAHHPGT